MNKEDSTPKPVLLFIQNKPKIYKLIAGEIGNKWRSFGREMLLKEGQLDNLEEQNKVLETRNYKMFEMIEQRWDEIDEDFVRAFSNGLEKAHRKDLAKEIRSRILKLML